MRKAPKACLVSGAVILVAPQRFSLLAARKAVQRLRFSATLPKTYILQSLLPSKPPGREGRPRLSRPAPSPARPPSPAPEGHRLVEAWAVPQGRRRHEVSTGHQRPRRQVSRRRRPEGRQWATRRPSGPPPREPTAKATTSPALPARRQPSSPGRPGGPPEPRDAPAVAARRLARPSRAGKRRRRPGTPPLRGQGKP